MTHRYAQVMFTTAVKGAQSRHGSRASYERLARDAAPSPNRLGPKETAFIAARDSFYIATVSETGWPYIQHRGGPRGFLKVIDEETIGFADFRGNRQYITVGNGDTDNRVSLFLMDYPNRRRLKLIGRMRTVERADAPDLMPLVEDPAYGAHVERAVIISIEAFDWNCPQHITPRYTEDEIRKRIAPLERRIAVLERELERACQPDTAPPEQPD